MQSNPRAKDINASSVWKYAVIASVLAHLVTAGGLRLIERHTVERKPRIIKIRVAEPVAKKALPLPPKPIKKERPPKPLPTPNEISPPDISKTETPVQGLTKDSLSQTVTMAAPLGNTLMTEDQGRRLTDVAPLKGDQSAPAKLIVSTLVPPPYADEALDAAIEGSFIVDVFINLDGSVREAELRKKIGYGMDSRVLSSVRSSRFSPRKNRFGVSEEGWTELKFTLVIP
ncbi:MAG: energy transducer TonB [Pseudomonadota bacterium]